MDGEEERKRRGATGRRSPAGHSIRHAAKATGIPRMRIQRAIELGQVPVINFGGLVLLSDQTVEVLRRMYLGEPAE